MAINPDSGHYFHEPTDAPAPIHEVLNRTAEAAHDATMADRARLDVLEGTLPVSVAGLTVRSPYSFGPGTTLFKIGNVHFLTLNLYRTPGGIIPEEVAVLPVGARPTMYTTFTGVASQGGDAGVVTMTMEPTNGVIKVWSTRAGAANLSATIFWVAGS